MGWPGRRNQRAHRRSDPHAEPPTALLSSPGGSRVPGIAGAPEIIAQALLKLQFGYELGRAPESMRVHHLMKGEYVAAALQSAGLLTTRKRAAVLNRVRNWRTSIENKPASERTAEENGLVVAADEYIDEMDPPKVLFG